MELSNSQNKKNGLFLIESYKIFLESVTKDNTSSSILSVLENIEKAKYFDSKNNSNQELYYIYFLKDIIKVINITESDQIKITIKHYLYHYEIVQIARNILNYEIYFLTNNNIYNKTKLKEEIEKLSLIDNIENSCIKNRLSYFKYLISDINDLTYMVQKNNVELKIDTTNLRKIRFIFLVENFINNNLAIKESKKEEFQIKLFRVMNILLDFFMIYNYLVFPKDPIEDMKSFPIRTSIYFIIKPMFPIVLKKLSTLSEDQGASNITKYRNSNIMSYQETRYLIASFYCANAANRSNFANRYTNLLKYIELEHNKYIKPLSFERYFSFIPLSYVIFIHKDKFNKEYLVNLIDRLLNYKAYDISAREFISDIFMSQRILDTILLPKDYNETAFYDYILSHYGYLGFNYFLKSLCYIAKIYNLHHSHTIDKNYNKLDSTLLDISKSISNDLLDTQIPLILRESLLEHYYNISIFLTHIELLIDQVEWCYLSGETFQKYNDIKILIGNISASTIDKTKEQFRLIIDNYRYNLYSYYNPGKIVNITPSEAELKQILEENNKKRPSISKENYWENQDEQKKKKKISNSLNA